MSAVFDTDHSADAKGRITSARTIRGSQLFGLQRQVQNLHVHLSETGQEEMEKKYADSMEGEHFCLAP